VIVYLHFCHPQAVEIAACINGNGRQMLLAVGLHRVGAQGFHLLAAADDGTLILPIRLPQW